jgi:hypothetical protein
VPRKFNAALWGIAAFALALRLALAAAQLPYHYQADEFQIVERALRVGAGDLNPGLFTWPGTLVIYINFVVYAGYFLVARVGGLVRDAAAFADLYWRDPAPFYFLGRAISSAFGVGAVVMCWRWARESYGAVAGLTAAAFVALAPAAVKASAVALPDMAAAALGAASLAYAVRFVQEPKTRHFVIAGFLLGLGAAAKYHVLLYAPALISCPFLARPVRGSIVKTLLPGAAAIIVAFILACPFAVLDARTFFADLAFMGRRPGMVRWLPSPGYVFGTTIPLTLSWPLVALTAAGVVSLIRRRDRFALVAALAAAPFVVATLIRPLPPRHLLPLIPPLAVAAGAVAASAADFKTRFLRVITATVIAVLICAALATDVAHVAWSWRKDTRSAAAEWIAANIPAGATVIVETLPPDVESPPLWPSQKALARLIKYYRDAGGGSPGRYSYQLKNPSYPFGRKTYDTRLAAEFDDLADAPAPAYAVLALPDDRDFFAEQAKPYGVTLTPRAEEYSRFLKLKGRVVKRFGGGRRPGPTVEIYRLN